MLMPRIEATPAGGFRPGDPWPGNGWFNAIRARATRGRLRSTAAGLDATGGTLSRFGSAPIWAKLSGSGPAYGFAEQVQRTGGGFAALPGGRTDDGGKAPAVEVNGVTGLSGVFRLHPSTAGDWRFRSLPCCGGSPAPSNPVGSIPYCFCDPMPATLTMTSADPSCNGGMFQSCTLQYQEAPSWAASLGITGMIYLSTTSFPDASEGGAQFYYYLTCLYDHYELTRLYPSSPDTTPPGMPARDGLLYQWNIGGYGNTCDPFHLDYGSAFPGSDLSCNVKIDAYDAGSMMLALEAWRAKSLEEQRAILRAMPGRSRARPRG
jgi:hypothetical protein